MIHARFVVILAAAAGSTLGMHAERALAANFPESEPNETKAQARQSNNDVTLASGDTITGTSTGAATTAGITSVDTFRVSSPATASGIYRHRLLLTSPTAGHTTSLRGYTFTGTAPTTNSDIAVQTSSTLTTPARMLQWYGFGRQELIYVRVEGATTTTAPYTLTKSQSVVTPVLVPGTIAAGAVTIRPNANTIGAYDTDLWVYNSNFVPIAGYDDPDDLGVTVTLGAGRFYIAMGDYNVANQRQATAGDFLEGPGLDADFAILSDDSTQVSATPMGVAISHFGGNSGAISTPLQGPMQPFEIRWFAFDVASPTTPVGSATLTPTTVFNDGNSPSVLRVTVFPAGNPTSTNLAVTANAASLGLGTIQLRDDGVAPDSVAGDNIFAANLTPAFAAAPGERLITYTITDAQGRTSGSNVTLTVADSNGACCIGTNCTVTTLFSCISNNGTFAGADTSCGSVEYAVSLSAQPYTSIASVGTLVAAATNSDDAVQIGVPIGFSFNFGPNSYTNVNISSNGNIQFPPSASASFTNSTIPNLAEPNNMLAPLWEDLNPGVAGDVYSFLNTAGGVGNRVFIVSWEAVTQFSATTNENFQVLLFEGSNNFEFRYGTITPEASAGNYTIGYENVNGTAGFEIPAAQIGSGNTGRRFVFSPTQGICSGPQCPACPADFNQDGGVNGGDIADFFIAFQLGAACADTDLDGGVTGSDIAAFFAAFQAGGC